MSDFEVDPRDSDSSGRGEGAPITAPATIVCVDCGGTCHLLSTAYEGEDGRVGFRAGDIVSYRCSDCLDRWDIELEEADA